SPPVSRSALFPSTTLFRSFPDSGEKRRPRYRSVVGVVQLRWPAGGSYATVGSGSRARLRRTRFPVASQELGLDELPGRGAGECVDRKSTRLNSSHVSISYA